MTSVGVLVTLTLLASTGIAVSVIGLMQPTPSLARTIRRLHHHEGEESAISSDVAESSATWRRITSPAIQASATRARLMPSPAELRILGRSVEHHTSLLVVATVVGGVAPLAVLGVLQAIGLLGTTWFVPVGVSLLAATLAPALVTSLAVDRARAVRTDLRYQVSAYLDVVTMLLAGNAGYEGALEQAADAGDGQLFVELRRRIRESGARGHSGTDALEATGAGLGLDELVQVAATARLSASEGAPVARTLAAKCATLRAALATEQEAEARVRTSRLTTPIVGMALIFMALVVYPALTFS